MIDVKVIFSVNKRERILYGEVQNITKGDDDTVSTYSYNIYQNGSQSLKGTFDHYRADSPLRLLYAMCGKMFADDEDRQIDWDGVRDWNWKAHSQIKALCAALDSCTKELSGVTHECPSNEMCTICDTIALAKPALKDSITFLEEAAS